MSENESILDDSVLDENVVVCKLMGMGHDHVCKNFSEEKCMLCQLKDKHNSAYSLIVNDINISYIKESGVDGLFRDLTPKNGLSAGHKEYVNNKLSELYAIKELINEIESGKCN